MSSVVRQLTADRIKGGKIDILMGGAELFISDSSHSDGDININISVTMGGIKLYIPSDWNVNIKTSTFMGGINDTKKSLPNSNGRMMTLTGNIFLGGVEIIRT
jgi:predicted membrane protein